MINWMLKPTTDLPSRGARKVANEVDKPLKGFNPEDLGGYGEDVNKLGAMIRGGLAGGVEGLGDLASSMTSPLSLGSMGLGALAGAAGRGVNTARQAIEPTLDVINDIPIKQIAPAADDVTALLGDLQRNLARIPGKGKMSAPAGIPASNLPAEMVAVGDELAHNAPRAARAIDWRQQAENVADASSRLVGKRRPVSGNLDVAKEMARVAAARGR